MYDTSKLGENKVSAQSMQYHREINLFVQVDLPTKKHEKMFAYKIKKCYQRTEKKILKLNTYYRQVKLEDVDKIANVRIKWVTLFNRMYQLKQLLAKKRIPTAQKIEK